MFRLLIFLILVLGLGFLFSWFADRPGEVTVMWQGTEYRTSVMVALTVLVATVAFLMLVWWAISQILRSPALVSRFFKARKRDRGYNALSDGLIAAGSGDMSSARRLASESRRLLGDEPMVGLLEAQTLLLEGDRSGARKQFTQMLETDKTRLVALRGLHLEAEREGERDAARHYAQEAVNIKPGLPWAANALLKYQSLDGDWQDAMKTLEMLRSGGQIDKAEFQRKRAVLATAQASALEPKEPEQAARLAQEAHRLAPDLVPAALIGAQALTRTGDLRRAARILETTWKKQPHPEIADAYVHLRSGDSVLDRLKRARRLAHMQPDHFESQFAVARAAIAAKNWKTARKAMTDVVDNHLTERACLIMADIEDGEYGDKGRTRDWLSRAVRAPRDAVWIADGYVSDHWLPVSPITGELDAFSWRQPVSTLGEEVNPAISGSDVRALIQPMDDREIAEDRQTEIASETILAQTTSSQAAKATHEAVVKPVKMPSAADRRKTGPDKPAPASAGKDSASQDDDREMPDNVVTLERMPDDPGVENDDEEKDERGRSRGPY